MIDRMIYLIWFQAKGTAFEYAFSPKYAFNRSSA